MDHNPELFVETGSGFKVKCIQCGLSGRTCPQKAEAWASYWRFADFHHCTPEGPVYDLDMPSQKRVYSHK